VGTAPLANAVAMMSRYLTALLLLCLLWSHTGIGQEKKLQPPNGQTKQALPKKNERPAPPIQIVTNSPVYEGAVSDTKHPSQNNREQWVSPAGATAVLTALLALCAVWAGWIGLGTLKAIRIQTEANAVSAKAAKVSADSLINIERPWLLVTEVEYSEMRGDGTESAAYVVLKNYGKSPAWILEMGGDFRTIKRLSELPAAPVYKTIKNEAQRGLVVVPLTVENKDRHYFFIPHESNTDVNHAEFDKAITQELLWVVFGYARYRDVFNAVRETRFCYVLGDSMPRFLPVDVGPEYNRHT